MTSKKILVILAVLIIIIVAFIFVSDTGGPDRSAKPDNNKNPASIVAGSWIDVELKDVLTGENYRISDFKGKTVLIESFAVWCPTCLRQQKEIKKLKGNESKEVVHISLDTDPNEDEDQVKNHANNNGLDWYFSISPVELTRGLIDEFGQTVVFAPSAPVILICEDQTARLLEKGVKTDSELNNEINIGC